jgi:hypothetical protein
VSSGREQERLSRSYGSAVATSQFDMRQHCRETTCLLQDSVQDLYRQFKQLPGPGRLVEICSDNAIDILAQQRRRMVGHGRMSASTLEIWRGCHGLVL